MSFKIKKKKSFFNRLKFPDKIDILSEAIDLYKANRWQEAFNASQKAVKTYPNERRFWEIIAVSGDYLGEHVALQKAFGKLIAFDANDDQAWYGLALAYAFGSRVALSVKTYKQFLERFPEDSKAKDVVDFIKAGEKDLEAIFDMFGLPNNEESFNLACLHEKVQVLMAQGNFQQAIKKSEELLQKHPEFIPAYNNLSLIYFAADQPEKAIETAGKVLQMQPDNHHALGNIARFSFLVGNPDEAQNYANLLKKSKSFSSLIYSKKIETFALLGDDESVVKVFKDFRKQKIELRENEGFYTHLAAFSFYQLGKQTEARKIWQQAFDKFRDEFAGQNLEEFHLSPHERNMFSFPLRYWVSGKIFNELGDSLEIFLESRTPDLRLQDKIQEFFKKYPNILALLSIILERTDLSGKEFVIELIEWSKMPEALEMLKEFALGQKGSDAIRYQAAMALAQADYIPNKVNLWLEGELREIFLACFAVTSEAIKIEGYPLKSETIKLLGKGNDETHEKNFELAKQYYELALQVQPDHPSLLYNLMASKVLLDEEIDLQAELESLVSRFPTYSFAALSLALQKFKNGKIEEATAIAEKYRDQKLWHVTEIILWCRLNMELLIEKKEYEEAKMWFDLLKQYDTQDDHSNLEKYFEQVLTFSKFGKMLKKIEERSAKRKKKK